MRWIVLLRWVMVLWSIPAGAGEIYVAPMGKDSNPGTRGEPVASLERARDLARQAKSSGQGVAIILRGGVYEVDRSLELTEADSGSAPAPVVWRAAEGETAVLSGGRKIAGFEAVKDPGVLARMAEGARGHVMAVDLKKLGITEYGKIEPRGYGNRSTPAVPVELFVGGEPMTLARWPNKGFIKIKSIAMDSDRTFTYQGENPARWASAKDIWVHGYWRWDWADAREVVAAIDPAGHAVTITKGREMKAGQRFYFQNVLEELDSPGEYYINRAAGVMYFYPTEKGTADAVVSTLAAPIIQMKDAAFVTIQGLKFAFTRSDAIRLTACADMTVSGCTFKGIGNWAVASSGVRVRVTGCEIHDTGDGGVTISGGDRTNLSAGNNEVVNCHIHHFGRLNRCYKPAIAIAGVGNHVAHNRIHDGPHNAITLGGNEHMVEFNDISRTCWETGDVGAFYMGRDWTHRGNTIRYNFFHDIQGNGPWGAQGVYLDDCTSGTTVQGNLFYKVTHAILVGGGRDNIINNNVMVDCPQAIRFDGRGKDMNSPQWKNMIYNQMKPRLDAMHVLQPPYSTRYPKLAEIVKYYEKDAGVPPEGNVIARTVVVGGKLFHNDKEIKWLTLKDNLVTKDAGFEDIGKMDFRLRKNSPIWKAVPGFEAIPVERIGQTKN